MPFLLNWQDAHERGMEGRAALSAIQYIRVINDFYNKLVAQRNQGNRLESCLEKEALFELEVWDIWVSPVL